MTEFDLLKQGEKKYTMEDANEVLTRLLAPDGCPWDREQTHISLRQNMIEEAYEAVDAIDSGDSRRFSDELGDVLLQVLLHSKISEKDGTFSLLDVTDNLCRKLISRHTHIFGKDTASSGEESFAIWEKNKIIEKGLQSASETLSDLPKALPSLMRADKLQKRAAKVGFDWDSPDGALEKVQEEIEEVKEVLEEKRISLQKKDAEALSELEGELGDFLFAAVNYVRLLGVDPEVALHRCNEKFIRRFSQMEKLAIKEKKDFALLSFEEKDTLWNKVKEVENESR